MKNSQGSRNVSAEQIRLPATSRDGFRFLILMRCFDGPTGDKGAKELLRRINDETVLANCVAMRLTASRETIFQSRRSEPETKIRFNHLRSDNGVDHAGSDPRPFLSPSLQGLRFQQFDLRSGTGIDAQTQ